jgi:opacity protein-like surface antigen
MKKFLLITMVALLGMMATANAQIKFGAKAGVNLSNLTDFEDSKLMFGFHVGGFAEFAISDRIAIQPELLYSTQGAKAKGQDASLNLDYINVPVLLKINLVEGLSAEIGPQVGFLISSKAKRGGESASFKDFSKSLDVTAALGLSYTFVEKFVVGARYGFGLTKAFKDEAEAGKSKNSVIQVSFGYKF